MENPVKKTNEEMMVEALNHYEEVASKAHSWFSDIPKAIKFYYKNKGKQTPALSIVMGCLQEKKKAWEERQSKWMDEEKSLTDDTDFDDERLILIENINLSEQIINDLEEIINKNSS